MRKKILFIVPPCVAMDDLRLRDDVAFSPKIRKEIPLGALSLATYIEKYTSAEAKVLDLNLIFYELVYKNQLTETDTPEKIIERIISELRENTYDLGAISAIFNPTYGYIKIICKILKSVFPNILTIAGGGVPSNLYHSLFEDAPELDVISYGEGEIGISGVIASENENDYIEKSVSLITREKIREGKQFEFEFIEDLDFIPPLDFSLIEFEKYSSHVHSQDTSAIKAVPLMFSRGCPFNCCFCASHSVHGRKVRYNSIDRIKSDVKLFIDRYGVNTITVWDDNFFVNKNQAIALLDYFMELNLKIEFVNGFPVYRMDDDMATRLKKAGVNVITLAIESGNPRVLKEIIHKPLKIEMVEPVIECLRKYDFYIKGLFVIGFPGETKEDIAVTMDFIQHSKLNWVDIFIASPLPGSELYDVCIKKGYLKNAKMDNCNFWQGNIETEYFTADEIEQIQLYNMVKKDFVNNLDMGDERWDRALINFEYVINANHENPFAYYYGGIAAQKIGQMSKAAEYFSKFRLIMNENEAWRKLLERFVSEGIMLEKAMNY